MSNRTLEFEVANTGIENNLFKATLIPIGDDRFLKYAFHFRNIEFKFVEEELSVEYDLDVDIACDQVPDTITTEKQAEIKEFGHQILYKFVSNILDEIEESLDRVEGTTYTRDGCSKSCSGECHENI